jgi:hypothetical protein
MAQVQYFNLIFSVSFNADPDLAFYLNADPASQTNANPGLGQTLPSQKVGF